MPKVEPGLADVLQLVRTGRLAEAEKRLAEIAPLDPENAELLGLQGIVALQAGTHDKAVDLLTRSLAGDGPAPVMWRNIQALLTLAMSLRSGPLIKRALDRPVPVGDVANALRREDRDILVALVEQLATVGRREQALALLEPFMPQLSDEARFLELFGALMLAASRPEEALAPLKKAFGLGDPTSRLLLNLGTAAAATGDGQVRTMATQEFVERFPLFVSARKLSQTTTIGVAAWAKSLIRSRNIRDIHVPFNFIKQLAKRHHERYRIVSVLTNSPLALQAVHETPRPDMVYNAVTNAEVMWMQGIEDTVSTLVGNWGRPVINHPEKILKSDRLSAPGLYGGLDSWVIPKIKRYRKNGDPASLADRIEEAFDYPVIIRGLTENLGRNTALASDRNELLEAVGSTGGNPYFYAIQFHECRQDNGLSRKIRAAVAGDTIQVIRADYDTGWNVHGRTNTSNQDFYARRPELVENEIEICRDVDLYTGLPVMEALRSFRSRSSLDVFGIDFDVMPDGRLLFFEANASMVLLSNAHPDMPPHPPFAEEAFMAGFDSYLEDLKRENP